MDKYGKQIANLLSEDGVVFTKGPNNDIIERYSDVGTFHQEKENGLKFVVGFSAENEKANRMKKTIEALVPAEYLEIKKVQFSEAELFSAYEAVIKESRQWCFTIGIYNSKKIGIVGIYIGYAVLLSVLGISIAPMQL